MKILALFTYGLFLKTALATPTIYPKDVTLLATITNPTNSNIVADDSDLKVIWVMPPNTAFSDTGKLHTINANVGYCKEMAQLQGYSLELSDKMFELKMKEVESEKESKAIQEKLSKARQDLARHISVNNLSEIQTIDERLEIITDEILALNEKLGTCTQFCRETSLQIRDLKNEKKSLTTLRKKLITERSRDVREMERKKEAVKGLEKDLDDINLRWERIGNSLEGLRQKFHSMFATFGKLEGARTSLQFRSSWDDNINELQRLNPHFDFKRIHTQNAVITINMLGGETLQGQGAVLGYELAGVYSEGKLSYPSYPANLSGNIRLSLLGTCPIIYPELFKLNLPSDTDQMKYGMVISYEFPSSFEVDVTAEYNMYKMYQKIAKSGRKGGFFRSKRWSSIEEKTFFRDEFKVHWNEQDVANSLTEEQKADYEKDIRDNIFARLAVIGLPNFSNPGELVTQDPGASGAVVLSSALSKNPSCQMNKYCMAASIGVKVLDAIFGSSSSSASYTNIQDVNMKESWSRKQVVYKPWISSYH